MTSSAAKGQLTSKAASQANSAIGRSTRKAALPTSPRIGGPSLRLPKRANPHLATSIKPAVQKSVNPRLMTIFGVGVLGLSTYCGYLYTSYQREVVKSQSLKVPQDVSDRYNQTARDYDAEVELSEWTMGLAKKREQLVRMARGDVLEVSCGTGRNMKYYQLGEKRGVNEKGKSVIQGCRSVTFVDLSPQMAEIAQMKFEKLYPEFQQAAFRVQNAKDVVPPSTSTAVMKGSPTPETPAWTISKLYFDTILQTMGLCSTPDPVGVLRHLGSITEPEHGQILLLEHGRSYYDWLNKILDNLAAAHANRHGCWWNRDIGKIVEQSGLEIVEIKRYHLGTTWKVIAKPRPRALELGNDVKGSR